VGIVVARRLLTAGLGAIALAAAVVVAPSSAQAEVTITACSNAVVGYRQVVCAQTLAVRTAPGGAWMGELTQGQSFQVEQVSGSWVYGFAYGHINRNGWVQNGWFYAP
jgi:hypothetical protein